MSYAPTAPAAYARLLVIFAEAPDLAGVNISDGAITEDTDNPESLAVGYAGAESEDQIDATVTWEGYAAAPDREQYDIHCQIKVLAGDEDPVAPRARAMEMLAAAGQAIAGDRTLGGAVMSAALSRWHYRNDKTTTSVTAWVRFDVSIDAFTNR